jgi:hypothetical protein
MGHFLSPAVLAAVAAAAAAPLLLLLLRRCCCLQRFSGTKMHFKEEPDWGFKQQCDGWDQ